MRDDACEAQGECSAWQDCCSLSGSHGHVHGYGCGHSHCSGHGHIHSNGPGDGRGCGCNCTVTAASPLPLSLSPLPTGGTSAGTSSLPMAFTVAVTAATPHVDSLSGPHHGLEFDFPHHIPSRFLIPYQLRDTSSFCPLPLQPPCSTSSSALFLPPANARDRPGQVHSRYFTSRRLAPRRLAMDRQSVCGKGWALVQFRL